MVVPASIEDARSASLAEHLLVQGDARVRLQCECFQPGFPLKFPFKIDVLVSLRAVGRALGAEGEVQTKMVLTPCCSWWTLTK